MWNVTVVTPGPLMVNGVRVASFCGNALPRSVAPFGMA